MEAKDCDLSVRHSLLSREQTLFPTQEVPANRSCPSLLPVLSGICFALQALCIVPRCMMNLVLRMVDRTLNWDFPQSADHMLLPWMSLKLVTCLCGVHVESADVSSPCFISECSLGREGRDTEMCGLGVPGWACFLGNHLWWSTAGSPWCGGRRNVKANNIHRQREKNTSLPAFLDL